MKEFYKEGEILLFLLTSIFCCAKIKEPSSIHDGSEKVIWNALNLYLPQFQI